MTHLTHRTLLVLLAPCLLAMALACGGDDKNGGDTPNNAPNNAPNNTPNNTPNNAPNNDPGTACTTDGECADDETCDTDAGLCRLACTSDDDCSPTTRCGSGGFCVSRSTCSDGVPCAGDDEVCNTCQGRCERAEGGRTCTVDMNCLIDEFCDPCRKVCRPLGGACDACEEDLECGGQGDLCLDHTQGGRFCGQACTSTANCPRGFVCDESVGQCAPASGDCAAPEACLEASDCPSGQQCSPQLICVPGCSEGSCPNGEVCDNGACIPPCTSDDDCPEGAECEESGLCKIPGGCITSRDCPDAGTYCDLDQNLCVEGCEADSDCPGLQICRGNQCRTRPCDGNHLCAFGQVCDKDSGLCVEPEGPFCDPCDAEGENQCGGEPNQCLRITDEEGNPLGDFCAPACDPEDLDACPVGYRCQELQDQDMQVIGNVCFRNCTRGPI